MCIGSPRFEISLRTVAVACYDQMHLSTGRPPAKSSRLPDSFWKFVAEMKRKAGHGSGCLAILRRAGRAADIVSFDARFFLAMKVWEVVLEESRE